ncbi:2OG-Fe dioxygenase-domain-containing protein [Fimicolochytrium jonesii]|uniref:2OG-Fe dioxygenase-domain-containing protein n=1 Tax=Fimicolochytrium jonesii TaxID=1396493 RepID=UPI0022FEC41C|nr:2OG-Fe dioxygenase-domain-containing protein [Fimicolochytrium jonesii]KAI8821180.1 2OG-Fe dioxygenase-domain-containing protein [Fimicolochytrium jonesii]
MSPILHTEVAAPTDVSTLKAKLAATTPAAAPTLASPTAPITPTTTTSSSSSDDDDAAFTLPIATHDRILRDLRTLKEGHSHIRFNSRDWVGMTDAEIDAELRTLEHEMDLLPKDRWVPGNWSRFRSYSRAVVLPWEKPMRVRYLPPYLDENGDEQVPYNQGMFNADCNNVRRWYKPVTEPVRNLRLLNRMILSDVALCDWNEDELRHPILVGIHFVKTAPTPDWPVGINTPNALHQDGHKFSVVHMVRRRNAKGGENIVAAPQYQDCHPSTIPQEDVIATFTLEEPLDSFAVYDDKCTHYAGAVLQDDPSQSTERSVFILDIEPMVAAVCPI